MTKSLKYNTRDRLLNQAERLFSQKGFDAVSVREITAAASTNLAAVNYHFGNKMSLYLAVFKERWVPRTRRVRKHFDDYLAARPVTGIADVIRAFAVAFFEGPMKEKERYYHFHLMQRELANPSEAINMVVDEVIRPVHNEIGGLIQPFLPEGLSMERLTLSIFSTIGMLLYFTYARPVISLVMNQEFDSEFKPRVIDHIVSFATDGINGLKKRS